MKTKNKNLVYFFAAVAGFIIVMHLLGANFD